MLRAIHLVEAKVKVDFRSKEQEVRLLGPPLPRLGGGNGDLENVEEGKTSGGGNTLGQSLKCTEKGCDFRADVENKKRGGEHHARYIYFVIKCRYSDEDLTAVEIVKSHLALKHGRREPSVTREVLVRWLEEEPRPVV